MTWVVWPGIACASASLLFGCGGRFTENADGAAPGTGGSGSSLAPTTQDHSGEYDLATFGSAQACAEVGETLPEHQLPGSVHLTIDQQATDLSRGTVMLLRTGEPLLEGRIFDARFVGSRFEVVLDGPLSETCKQRYAITLRYDFDGVAERALSMDYEQIRECRGNPGEYCQGWVRGTFGEATPRNQRAE